MRGRTKTRVHMQTQNVAVIMHFERPSPDSSWDCFHDAMMTPLQTRCLLSVRCNGIQNNYITVGQGAHLVPGSTFLLPHGCGDDKANHVKLALAFTSIGNTCLLVRQPGLTRLSAAVRVTGEPNYPGHSEQVSLTGPKVKLFHGVVSGKPLANISVTSP